MSQDNLDENEKVCCKKNISIRDTRIYMLLSILSFLMVTCSCILFYNTPALGYEFSPYDPVPLIVWIFVFLTFFFGAYILLDSQSKSKSISIDYWGLMGLSILLLNNIVVLFFPYIRGMFMMSIGDLLSHAGFVLEILTYGHIDTRFNFYPFTHILSAIITMTSSSSYFTSIKLLNPIFTILSVLWIYSLSKIFIKNKKYSAFVVICSCVFTSNLSNSITTPNGLSILMLPLIFFLYFKSKRNTQYKILLLICLTSYAFFHPLTSVILVIGMLFIELFIYLDQSIALFKNSNLIKKEFYLKFDLTSVTIAGVLFCVWLFYCTSVWMDCAIRFTDIFLDVFYERGIYVGTTPTALWETRLAKSGIEGLDLIILFFKMFGTQFIYLIITGLVILYVYKKIMQRKAYNKNIFKFSGWFIFNFTILLIAIAVPTFIGITFFRFLNFSVILSPILVGYGICLLCTHFQNYKNLRSKIRFVILIALSFIFLNSVFVLYSSPYIHQPNIQATYSDISEAKWLLQYKDTNIKTTGYLDINKWTASAILPYTDYYARKDLRYPVQLPDHIGYDNYSSVNQWMNESSYILINNFDIVTYSKLYTLQSRILPEDISLIGNDTSVDFIYYNGKGYVYFFQSKNKYAGGALN